MIECPDFLPLGSVAVLKGNAKKLLVIGRALAVENDEGEKEYYDYSFALYPEGLVRDTVIYSNHDCIDEVLFRGFEDEENAAVIETLKEILPKMDLPKANPQPVGEW